MSSEELEEANRCIEYIIDYLLRHESPRGASDLRKAIDKRERAAWEAARAVIPCSEVSIDIDGRWEHQDFDDWKKARGK